jgi:hypothetical protein
VRDVAAAFKLSEATLSAFLRVTDDLTDGPEAPESFEE